jgi:hypothetical protein
MSPPCPPLRVGGKILRLLIVTGLLIVNVGCPDPLMDDGDVAGIFHGTVSGPGGEPVDGATVRIGTFDIGVPENCSEQSTRDLGNVTSLTDENGYFRERVRTYSSSPEICAGILVIPPEGSGLTDGYVGLPEVRLVHDEDELPEIRADVRLTSAGDQATSSGGGHLPAR